MDSLDQAVVRAVIEARLAAAGERRLAHDAARDRRAARRDRRSEPTSRRARRTWPWRRQAPAPGRPPAPATDALRMAQTPTRGSVTDELGRLLEDLIERVAEHGTDPDRGTLDELAASTRSVAPGAAAALVDRDGSEVARLRALGVLHGVALSDLTTQQQARLLDAMRGGTSRTQALVA